MVIGLSGGQFVGVSCLYCVGVVGLQVFRPTGKCLNLLSHLASHLGGGVTVPNGWIYSKTDQALLRSPWVCVSES